MILGLGVIGTTYGYALQKAGIETRHFVREEKRESCPECLSVKLLDGRKNNKGTPVQDTYEVSLARPGDRYDLILVSVSSDKLLPALEALLKSDIGGTILLMNGVKEDRRALDALMGDRPYILGYPVAGGQIDWEKAELDCAMFDHIMLEREDKSKAGNYRDILAMFERANIHAECLPDMLEWIWLHMAINAGVIATAAALGDIRDSAARRARADGQRARA